jgi:hypothetical protein
MATLSDFAKIRFSNMSETFDPSVESSEMERGPPKYRVLNSQVLMKLSVTLLFLTSDDSDAFEDWYFNEVKRIGSFPVLIPRNGKTVVANFEKGSIGTLTFQGAGFHFGQRDVVLEYLR